MSTDDYCFDYYGVGGDDVTRPAWVMVGEENANQVTLYASNQLTEAELTTAIENVSAWDVYGSIHTVTTYTLSAVAQRIVIIRAPDWPTAFRRLFDCWSPDGDRPRLAPPPGRIPPH